MQYHKRRESTLAIEAGGVVHEVSGLTFSEEISRAGLGKLSAAMIYALDSLEKNDLRPGLKLEILEEFCLSHPE
jgi:hypothetical protein